MVEVGLTTRSSLLAGCVLCLVMGAAVLAYLNLHVLPALWSERETAGSIGGMEKQVKAVPKARETKPQEQAPPPVQPVAAVAAQEPFSPGGPDQRRQTDRAAQPESAAVAQEPFVRKEPEQPQPIVLRFDPQQHLLSPEHRMLLLRALESIPERAGLRVVVDGHSDATGRLSVDNDLLSRKRAEAVAAFLQTQGIAADRIVSKGYGTARPMDRNNTPAAWERNRRAEVRFFKETP